MKRRHVIFADFECSTDGLHKAYCVCFQYEDGKEGWFYGEKVTERFLDVLTLNQLTILSRMKDGHWSALLR